MECRIYENWIMSNFYSTFHTHTPAVDGKLIVDPYVDRMLKEKQIVSYLLVFCQLPINILVHFHAQNVHIYVERLYIKSERKVGVEIS